jgi:hypothetical protein
MIKTILNFVVIFLLANLNLNAQDSAKPLDWKSYYKDNKIEISYKYADCKLPSRGSNRENVYLKIANKTSDKIAVRWNTEYWYNEKCANCISKEGMAKVLLLEAQEAKEGTCSEACAPELKIFSKMLDLPNQSILTDFKMKDITVYNLSIK